jgi:hypothetical protein
MDARFGKHPTPLLEYQYMNQLKPLAKLNPSETVALNQLGLPVGEYLDAMVAVEAMADQELCCTTGLAFHFHPELFL